MDPGFWEVEKRVREEFKSKFRELGRFFGGGLGQARFLVAIDLGRFGGGWRRPEERRPEERQSRLWGLNIFLLQKC